MLFHDFNTFLREFVPRERKVLSGTRTVLMRAYKASATLIQYFGVDEIFLRHHKNLHESAANTYGLTLIQESHSATPSSTDRGSGAKHRLK